jgi:valyl-tRNA synthetase
VLNHALVVTMKLLHPFMPFITEEIFQTLPGTEGSIMVSAWPVAEKKYDAEEKAMGNVMEIIRGIRNIRAEMNVPAGKKALIRILATPETKADYEICAKYIERLGMASSVEFISDKSSVPENAISVIGVGAEAFMALGYLIDIEKEIKRLDAETARLENEIKRAEGKLNNEGFVSKAPEKVIQDERGKVKMYADMLETVRQRRAELSR